MLLGLAELNPPLLKESDADFTAYDDLVAGEMVHPTLAQKHSISATKPEPMQKARDRWVKAAACNPGAKNLEVPVEGAWHLHRRQGFGRKRAVGSAPIKERSRNIFGARAPAFEVPGRPFRARSGPPCQRSASNQAPRALGNHGRRWATRSGGPWARRAQGLRRPHGPRRTRGWRRSHES